MDVTFVVERLSRSEWVVVCDPYGLPVKTFSSLDAAASTSSRNLRYSGFLIDANSDSNKDSLCSVVNLLIWIYRICLILLLSNFFASNFNIVQ